MVHAWYVVVTLHAFFLPIRSVQDIFLPFHGDAGASVSVRQFPELVRRVLQVGRRSTLALQSYRMSTASRDTDKTHVR